MTYLWKSGVYSGVSKRAFHFLTKRGKQSTRNNYNHGWRVFSEWWNEQRYHNEDISPARVVEFLVHLFDLGYSGSIIANTKSAISKTALL